MKIAFSILTIAVLLFVTIRYIIFLRYKKSYFYKCLQDLKNKNAKIDKVKELYFYSIYSNTLTNNYLGEYFGKIPLYLKLSKIKEIEFPNDYFDIRSGVLNHFYYNLFLDYLAVERKYNSYRPFSTLKYPKEYYIYSFLFFEKYYGKNSFHFNQEKLNEFIPYHHRFLQLFFESDISIGIFNTMDKREQFILGVSNSPFIRLNINKIWKYENLNVDTFRNGDKIKEAANLKDWNDALIKKEPCFCSYQFDKFNDVIYGKIYNAYALLDARHITPIGWKIPNKKDFDFLNTLELNRIGLLKETNFNIVFSGKLFKPINMSDFCFEGVNQIVTYATADINLEEKSILSISFSKKEDSFNLDTCKLGFDRGYSVKCLKE